MPKSFSRRKLKSVASTKAQLVSFSCRTSAPFPMFDTVRFELCANPARNPPDGSLHTTRIQRFRFWHSRTTGCDCVELSLPSLLFGHSGRLISSQVELDAAIACLDRAAQTLGYSLLRPTRLDLAWHFGSICACRVVDALSSFGFPGVRGLPLHRPGSFVSWRGARSQFVLSAYAKAKLMRLPGDVLRVEVRLCGRELCRLKGRDWRSFAALWQTFREIVAQMPDVSASGEGTGWPEAVGRCVPVEFHERTLAQIGGSDRTRREYRRRIRVAAAALPSPLRWSELVPEVTPAPVNLQPKSRRTVHRSPESLQSHENNRPSKS